MNIHSECTTPEKSETFKSQLHMVHIFKKWLQKFFYMWNTNSNSQCDAVHMSYILPHDYKSKHLQQHFLKHRSM